MLERELTLHKKLEIIDHALDFGMTLRGCFKDKNSNKGCYFTISFWNDTPERFAQKLRDAADNIIAFCREKDLEGGCNVEG